jgi:hypothetical protein
LQIRYAAAPNGEQLDAMCQLKTGVSSTICPHR